MTAAGAPWTLVGAPLNSSGVPGGERDAPAALRAAGVAQALGARDAGDADSVLDDDSRDPRTGLIGFEGLRRASHGLRTRLGRLLGSGHRPLVIGGDCAMLLGIVAALRDHHDRVGLWFLDGHADFYDGRTSPSGEGADMELAIITGHGPAGLVDLAEPPLIAARDVALLGHRRPEQAPDVREELGYLPPDLFYLDATTIAERGPARIGKEVEQRLVGQVDRVWLHLDLDVLDEDALPAVSYPQPNGLDWSDLAALMGPLVASPALLGLSVADYNPDRDLDGRYALRIVELLTDLAART